MNFAKGINFRKPLRLIVSGVGFGESANRRLKWTYLRSAAANTFVAGNAASAADALAHVRVMNLVDLSGGNAQDQLYIVPEPGSVAIWGLAVAGLFAGSFFKRKKLSLS